MNVEIGTEAAHFPFWGNFFPFFGTVSLQCTRTQYLHTFSHYPLLEPEIYVRALCMTGVYELISFIAPFPCLFLYLHLFFVFVLSFSVCVPV